MITLILAAVLQVFLDGYTLRFGMFPSDKAGQNVWIEQVIAGIDTTADWTDWQRVRIGFSVAAMVAGSDTSHLHSLAGQLWEKQGIPVLWVDSPQEYPVPLVPVEEPLFGVSFFRIGSHRYYDFIQSHFFKLARRTVTIRESEENRNPGRPLRLLEKPPAVIPDPVSRLAEWSWNGQSFSLIIRSDRNLISFYRSLPVMDFRYALNFRFTAGDERQWLADLHQLFKKEGLDEYQIAESLRQLILQVFPYQDDRSLYGREHLSWPPELFFAEGSDCEDRSILLALLLMNLTHLPVYLADFPDHVSVLIRAPETWNGDVYFIDNQPYIYLDPTYYDAPFGEIPDLVRGLTPDVLKPQPYL
ncbi:MAG: hypothetical protein HUU10_06145 [Bacteroidetes bacterium]|nr:hypothetical protein [Bacteroidota bacterium]